MERETGFEPATNSLEGCDSTPELLPLGVDQENMVEAGGFEPPSGEARQIYSLLPLSTRPHLQRTSARRIGRSRHPDLNRGPTVYKTVALPLSYAGGSSFPCPSGGTRIPGARRV